MTSLLNLIINDKAFVNPRVTSVKKIVSNLNDITANIDSLKTYIPHNSLSFVVNLPFTLADLNDYQVSLTNLGNDSNLGLYLTHTNFMSGAVTPPITASNVPSFASAGIILAYNSIELSQDPLFDSIKSLKQSFASIMTDSDTEVSDAITATNETISNSNLLITSISNGDDIDVTNNLWVKVTDSFDNSIATIALLTTRAKNEITRYQDIITFVQKASLQNILKSLLSIDNLPLLQNCLTSPAFDKLTIPSCQDTFVNTIVGILDFPILLSTKVKLWLHDFSLKIITPPINGFASVSGSLILYTPNPNFVGKDTFTYSAANSFGSISSPATITIHVKQIYCSDSTINVAKNSFNNPIQIPPLTKTWYDSCMINIIQSCTNGRILVLNNSINYTPSPNFVGTDSIIYNISSPTGALSDPTTIVIKIS